MSHLLSILVCTIPSRRKFLSRLMAALEPQLTPDVQVITDGDDAPITRGAKRQRMLQADNSEYVCYFDDDDIPSTDYVARITTALVHRPDCVGFDVRRMQKRNPGEPFRCVGIARHTIDPKRTPGPTKENLWQWDEVPMDLSGIRMYSTHPETDMWWFRRTPNHLNPIRRELAMKVGFPDRHYGEDRDYGTALLLGGHLKHEIFVDGPPMYEYLLRDESERAMDGELVQQMAR